jgi:hypothetical protein
MISYWDRGRPPLIPATAEQADWTCFRKNRSALDKVAGALGQRLSFAIITASWKGEIELWAKGYYARQNYFLDRPINLTDKHFSEFGALLSHAMSHLTAMSARRILLIGPIPGTPKDMPDCLLRADRKKLDWDETCSFSRSDVDLREAATGQMLRGVAGTFGSVVRYLDPLSALCDDRFCRSHNAGSALYVDTVHLSQAGVERLYAAYAGDFEWAFAGKK